MYYVWTANYDSTLTPSALFYSQSSGTGEILCFLIHFYTFKFIKICMNCNYYTFLCKKV